MNALQACSRWCLSLKANKCFGALIYLHKYHLNYRGQKAQLQTPFLVDLHLVVTSTERTGFTLLQSVCYSTIDGLFRFAQMHLKDNLKNKGSQMGFMKLSQGSLQDMPKMLNIKEKKRET